MEEERFQSNIGNLRSAVEQALGQYPHIPRRLKLLDIMCTQLSMTAINALEFFDRYEGQAEPHTVQAEVSSHMMIGLAVQKISHDYMAERRRDNTPLDETDASIEKVHELRQDFFSVLAAVGYLSTSFQRRAVDLVAGVVAQVVAPIREACSAEMHKAEQQG